MSAAETQAVSGAAQGAAMGFVVGGPVGAAVGGGLGFVGGLFSGGSADKAFKNQMAWAKYNNTMEWNTTMGNIQSSFDLALMSAGLNMAMAAQEAAAARAYAAYNAEMTAAVTNYTSLLLTDDLRKIWEAEDLDLTQLELYTAREQGMIIADQSASGTVIGEESNEDVAVSALTMRALDGAIIMHNADEAAAGIQNQMAQNVWQGQVAIGQTLWEGEMVAHSAKVRAAASSASTIGTTIIQGKAGIQSAQYAYDAGINNISQAKYQNKQQNYQNMIGGLFQAGGTLAMGHFANKVPGGGTTGGSGFHPRNANTALYKPPAYTPGTSLITGP